MGVLPLATSGATDLFAHAEWIIQRLVVYSYHIFLERGWFLWIRSVSNGERSSSLREQITARGTRAR